MDGITELKKLDRNLQGLIHQLGAVKAAPDVSYFGQQLARLKLLPLLKQLRYAMEMLVAEPVAAAAAPPRPPKSKKTETEVKVNAEDFFDDSDS